MTVPKVFLGGRVLYVFRTAALCAIMALLHGCFSESYTPAQPAGSAVPLVTYVRFGSAELSDFAPESKVVINIPFDPLYKRGKRYEGLPLPKLAQAMRARATDCPPDADLLFICSDGYFSSLSLSNASKATGVLATRDLSSTNSLGWEPFRKSDASITPSPFYLVWPDTAVSATHLPWPYGIVEVRLTSPIHRFHAPSPRANIGVLRGYSLFQQRCQSCHSVNGVGGTVGPELNVPNNVTEYWRRTELQKFLINPQTYRLHSKMPVPSDMTDGDIDDVINYLVAMKDRKVRTAQPQSTPE